jgi:opacity protein-like surface antigen
MARCRIVPLMLACGILLACASARAQEPNKDRRFGLTAAYPGSGGLIGLVWQTSDRWAFRPELSFSARFHGENNNTDSSTVGIAVTVLRYVAKRDNASLYVGPRLSYSRNSTTNGGVVNQTSSVYGAGVNLGLQYELTRRISVYGEVGAAYSYQRATSEGITPTPITSHAVTSRGAVGLNLFF